MTDEHLLRSLVDDDADTENEYHVHFESLSRDIADWVDVGDEALRMFNLLFSDGSPAQHDSAVHHWILSIASASADAAIRRIARTLGINAELIKEAEYQSKDRPDIDRVISRKVRDAISAVLRAE